LGFFSRTGTLLRGCGISALGNRSEAAEESIDDSSRVKQVFERAECHRGWCRAGFCCRGQVGPIGRDQSFTAIGQNQKEKQATFAIHRPANAERFTFERMARTDNSYFFGEVLMMGSVSQVPSILSRIPSF